MTDGILNALRDFLNGLQPLFDRFLLLLFVLFVLIVTGKLVLAVVRLGRCAGNPADKPISVFRRKRNCQSHGRKRSQLIVYRWKKSKDPSNRNNYFKRPISKIAGIVEISNHMQPQIQITNAVVERIGDSHSKQLLLAPHWTTRTKQQKKTRKL